MDNPETKTNLNTAQAWDMSDISFAGAEQESKKEQISKALRYAPELLSISAIFSEDIGRTSDFTNTILLGTNTQTLNKIKTLDDGRYFENYGVDFSNRGYTGLGQVSGALEYFDNKYGYLIDNTNLKGIIKTSLAMWPMGSLANFGVQEFARSAKIDQGTADLVKMLIDRNLMKLAQTRFEQDDHAAGEQLLQANKSYLEKIGNRINGDYEKEAICACNLQKIIMKCAKNGAIIARERKIPIQP